MFWSVAEALSFTAYAAVMSVTPGPNNAMLASMGARHGFWRTAPAAAGVMAGLFGLLVAAGSGIGAAVAAAPALKAGLACAGAAYMGWLAVVLWRSGKSTGGKAYPRIGFWAAAVLQLVNPKGLLMALTASATFLPPAAGIGGAVVLAACYVAIGAPCVSLWAIAGDRLRQRSPAQIQAFSRMMAVLLACTAASVFAEAPSIRPISAVISSEQSSHPSARAL